MNLTNILTKYSTNKTVSTVVKVISLFNIIGYLVMGKMIYAGYFIGIALIARYFSKNWTIVLGIPLIVVNLMSANFVEGMTTNDKTNIENLVKKVKMKNSEIIVPLENGPINIEGFERIGEKKVKELFGANIKQAYKTDKSLSKFENQLQLLDETKRMGPSIEKFSNIKSKHSKLMPFSL